MGADLYAKGFEKFRKQWERKHGAEWERLCDINPRPPEVQEQIEKLHDSMYPVELYFRDSYNPTSIMGRLGLSWWRDVIPLLRERKRGVNAPPAVCLEVAHMVEAAPLTLLTMSEWQADFAPPPEGDTLDEWNRYFVEKHARLVRFLKTCANEGGCDMSL